MSACHPPAPRTVPSRPTRSWPPPAHSSPTSGPRPCRCGRLARRSGSVSSAVYRYFPSRDELLTALIVEAYDELGDAVEAADRAVRRQTDLAKRFRAVADAIRDWARDQPARVRTSLRLPRPGLRRTGRHRDAGDPGHRRLPAPGAGVRAGRRRPRRTGDPGHRQGTPGTRRGPPGPREPGLRRADGALADRLVDGVRRTSHSSCSATCTAASSTTTRTSPRSPVSWSPIWA